MRNVKSKKSYAPQDMEIVEYHRFEGASNPSDMSIVLAVEGKDGIKGIIISPFGMYADVKMIEFIDKVKIKERESSK